MKGAFFPKAEQQHEYFERFWRFRLNGGTKLRSTYFAIHASLQLTITRTELSCTVPFKPYKRSGSVLIVFVRFTLVSFTYCPFNFIRVQVIC